jgi:flagellar hook-associated protein 1 FlgK
VAKVDTMPLSAGNVTVNEALLNDPDLLAIKESIATGEANATVMEKLNKLQTATIFDGGTSSYYLESIISDMSIDAQKANSLYTNYNNLKTTIQNQRLSVMGVDTDEEAMDLVKFQQAYNLNSKMLSVMNEIYDRLINYTGV